MPAAAIPLISAGVGAAGSVAGGKKGKNAANAQSGIQGQMLDFAKQAYGTGMTAWNPAANYWESLLKGGNTAVQATGPYANLIRQNTAGTQNQLQSQLPQGGERNLALAQNMMGQNQQLASLYAGMGPYAAQQLGAISGIPMGIASTGLSAGAPNISSALKYNTHQQELAGQGAYGLGSVFGGKGQGGGGGGGKGGGGPVGTPPFIPSSGGGKGTGQGVF